MRLFGFRFNETSNSKSDDSIESGTSNLVGVYSWFVFKGLRMNPEGPFEILEFLWSATIISCRGCTTSRLQRCPRVRDGMEKLRPPRSHSMSCVRVCFAVTLRVHVCSSAFAKPLEAVPPGSRVLCRVRGAYGNMFLCVRGPLAVFVENKNWLNKYLIKNSSFRPISPF